MRKLIRRLRIPKLFIELGIIVLGLIVTALAIWIFDALPLLVSWVWFIAGMLFGVVMLCLVVAFFAFGARGEGPAPEEFERPDSNEQPKAKPRLVQNGKSRPK